MKHIIPSDLRYTITLALKKEFFDCLVNQFYNTEQAKSGRVCYLITDRNAEINNHRREIIHYVHYDDGLFWYTGWRSNCYVHRWDGSTHKILLSDPDCFAKIKSLTDKSLLDYNAQLVEQITARKAKRKYQIHEYRIIVIVSFVLFFLLVLFSFFEYYYYF